MTDGGKGPRDNAGPHAFTSEDILENIHDAVVSMDLKGVIESWSAGAERMYGYSSHEMIGRHISLLYFEEDLDLIAPQVLATTRAQGSHEIDLRNRHKDGREIFVSVRLSLLRDSHGEPISLLGCSNDITKQRETEAARRALQKELEHRIKNMAATVHAVVDQSIDAARSMEELAVAVRGRVGAIAGITALLTQSNGPGIDLRELLGVLVMPHADRGTAVSLEGEPVFVPSAVVRPLGMALHELATNAAAHGSLSRPAGRLSVGWRVEGTPDGLQLRLRWCEHGGPAVSAPDRRGLGVELIEQVIPYETGGDVRLTFDMGGVECEIRLPFSKP